MKMVFNESTTANTNKGYTMRKITSLIRMMLKNAKSFNDFVDAFDALADDLMKTDYFIFFSTGDDYGFRGKDAENWFFSVENTHKKNEKTYNITKEIENMKD